jgi:hypothetical protein
VCGVWPAVGGVTRGRALDTRRVNRSHACAVDVCKESFDTVRSNKAVRPLFVKLLQNCAMKRIPYFRRYEIELLEHSKKELRHALGLASWTDERLHETRCNVTFSARTPSCLDVEPPSRLTYSTVM